MTEPNFSLFFSRLIHFNFDFLRHFILIFSQDVQSFDERLLVSYPLVLVPINGTDQLVLRLN